MGQEVAEQSTLSIELHKSASTAATHARRVYSKEFLLSVAELKDCKIPPSGLDSALLRETQCKSNDQGVAIPGASAIGLIHTTRENDAPLESPPDVPEWRRPSSLPGSPFLKNGPRQVEPSVSSPRPGSTRAGNNAARSIMGRSGSARWELHPSGTDRDRDLNRTQYDWESASTESGGRPHSRGLVHSALVVSQEHDGLLGSGGPILQRGVIQTPTPDRRRAERGSRTGRTGEPYHSARGGKMSRGSHYARREDTDLISDETFGSDDLPNGERSEQERQRRDSFEQMRKELRMKPLNIGRKYNDNWLGDGVQGTESLLSSSPGTPQSTTSSKDDILKPHNKAGATSSTPRLLVPPGFSKPSIAKTGSPKENNEASKSPLSLVKDEDMHVLEQTSSSDGLKSDKGEHHSSLLPKIDQVEDKDQQASSPVTSKFARWFPSQGSNLKEDKLNIDKKEAILLVPKSEDLQPLLGILSSKTPAEQAGGSEDAVLGKLSSVASLMPNTKKGSVLPMPAGPSLEDVEKVMTAGTDFAGVVSSNEDRSFDRKSSFTLDDHALKDNDHAVMGDAALLMEALHPQRPSSKDVSEKKMSPVVLTCEDLEQSFLAESAHSGNHSRLKEEQQNLDKNIPLMQLLQTGSINRASSNISQQSWASEQDSAKVMNESALHIMSLLQKKSGDAITAVNSAESAYFGSAEASSYLSRLDHTVEDARKKQIQGNTAEIISLETLFGKGFVNELRSVGEPVSSKLVVNDTGKEKNLLDVVLPGRQSTKSGGHAEAAFSEEARWDYDRHFKEPKASESVQGADLQKEFWSDISPHGHAHTKNPKNFFPPRGVSMNGAASGDFRQPLSPHLPHQGKFSRGLYHEGHHLPPSEVPSHRMPYEPVQEHPFIHDSAFYGVSTYGANGPFHGFQDGFIRAGSRVPGHFDQRPSMVESAYRMAQAFPPDYPESIQMGFNPNPGMSDPRIGASRMHHPADKWFAGDHMQASQGRSNLNHYQHQVPAMVQERKPVYGASGQGVGHGARSYNAGMPPDKRAHSETTQIPYVPGLDPYILSGSLPDYG